MARLWKDHVLELRLVGAKRIHGRHAPDRSVQLVEQLVREARRTSEQIIEDAERQAALIRHEAEDYVDRKLAAFEVVLDRTMQQVQKGRERLQVNIPAEPLEADDVTDASGFFDQDDA